MRQKYCFSLFFLIHLALITPHSSGSSLSIPELFKGLKLSVVTIQAKDTIGKTIMTGTGFFVGSREVVTNAHVLKGASSASIKTFDGREFVIKAIIGDHDGIDLVRISVDCENNCPSGLIISKTLPDVGERIFIVGSPLGLELTVSDGIVSAIRSRDGNSKVLQVSAAISQGSSGSPVFNIRGEVVGIASEQIIQGQNLNFAIPSEMIDRLAKISPQGLPEWRRANTNKGSEKAKFAYQEGWNLLEKDRTQALEWFRASSKANSTDPYAYFGLGHCCWFLGHLNEAVNAYLTAISLRPDFADAYSELAMVYSRLKEPDKALEVMRRAVNLDPYDPEKLNRLGDLYREQGNMRAAIEAWQRVLHTDPSKINFGSLWLFWSTIDDLGAEEFYKLVLKARPNCSEAYQGLGSVHLRAKRHEAAILAYQHAARLCGPRNGDCVLATLGLVGALSAGGRHIDAVQVSRNAISREANDYNISLLYMAQGDAYMAAGRFAEAAQAFNNSLRLDKFNPILVSRLAQAYNRIGQHNEALEAFKQAVRSSPDSPGFHAMLSIQYSQMERFAEAAEAALQAIHLDPDDPRTHELLGHCYWASGDYRRAIEALEHSLSIGPKSVEAHYLLGFSYLMLGDRAAALEQYRDLKDLDKRRANDLFELIYK